MTWVAVSELSDPTPYLEGGELVLLTGLGADLRTGAAAYVGRLVGAKVAALGFGVGVVHDEVPPELVTAAAAAGLPLLEVDRPTPFVAVGKALADLLAIEQGEYTRRRLDGMQALTARLVRATATHPSVHPTLRQLAGLVGGWAAVLDSRARIRLEAGHDARPDVAVALALQLRGRRSLTSAVDADAEGRVIVLPLGVRERPHGYLSVGVGPGADLDHHLVAFAASLLTLDAEHARGARPAERWARAAALAARVGRAAPEPPGAVRGPLTGTNPVRALVLRRSADAVLNCLDDEDSVAALPLDDGASLLMVADRDVEELLAAVSPCPGGLSDVVPTASVGDPVALVAAIDQAQALAARSREEILQAGAVPPTVLDLLGAHAAAAFADATLAPLRRLADGLVLEESLRAYLVARGGLAAAAAALQVHRHTLRARLRRVSTVLGRDLDDPSTRSELWIALSAVPPSRAGEGPGV